jgi:hypothetical protein
MGKWDYLNWGSHLEPLFTCLLATSGPVLEVGMGWWSTPPVFIFCKATERELVSVEPSAAWAEEIVSEYPHRLERYSLLPELAKKRWSIVFIDHWPGTDGDHAAHRRVSDALLFKDTAEFTIIHDYGPPEIMDAITPVLDSWKHRKMFERANSTMVLSNSRPIPVVA